MEIFTWMEWVISRNMTLSERSLAAIKPFSAKMLLKYIQPVTSNVQRESRWTWVTGWAHLERLDVCDMSLHRDLRRHS
ncbi:hypothetical protein PHMEG_00018577 [Phytophthora megakarya]|uniref:Uncharacterized protein n=1 Tax=Phytophthora megakarya TaxID=4795 RepID=A0A225VU17_9STRA|nr:hypothetical protein PHMEG_00018577 [Phytophthora megakarya]